MNQETANKLFVKVATYDKAAKLMAGLVLANYKTNIDNRKAEVQTKVASIIENTLSKKETSENA
jgi:hypothetical protein